MVFQEYALFPWMTVAQNIAFGLEVQKIAQRHRPDGESAAGFAAPERLSRPLPERPLRRHAPAVAIARVLALDSPIMLMDEPFGALDALTRRNLQDELLRIWEKLGKTILFVTHSIEESIYLADRIVVMTYRPGTVKRDQRVDMPRPRDPSSAAFNALKRELGALVMEEQQRHANAEMKLAAVD